MIFEGQTADPSPEAEYKLFHEMVDQAVLAEQVGFDRIWAVEHTALTWHAHMSAPETFLAFVAGKTEKIDIGHGVVCLPPAMNHPVKVAERIATLDILSKGRVQFGIGKGGSQQESGTFGYDLSELQPQIDEMMYLIPKIMTQDTIEHDGKYVKIPKRPIHPKCAQKPHPKMYMACTKPETIAVAGARGLGALSLGFGGADDVRIKNDIYRKAFKARKEEEQVGLFANEHLSALCPAIVLDDREKARRIGLRGQRFFIESVTYWFANGPEPTVDDLTVEEQLQHLKEDKELFLAAVKEVGNTSDVYIAATHEESPDAYGTVPDCIRYVQSLLDAGADEVMFLIQMGGVSQEACLETIRNIGEHVIPHFREKYGEKGERRHQLQNA